jgi:hypothetical protein
MFARLAKLDIAQDFYSALIGKVEQKLAPPSRHIDKSS